MLYLLKHEEGSTFYYLISGKEYIVGRKNADITIPDDQSISRKHALFKVESDSIKLIDCGSKYGTWHKGSKIQANTEVQLEDQDTIKFGVFKSIFKLEKVNVVTTGSGLNSSQKNSLKKDLDTLGGTCISNWDSTCTHLTIQEIALTIKVLHALIDGKPMVTLNFWKTFVQKIKTNQPPPKVEDFKPPLGEMFLDESELNSNPKRKVIFKNKIFVFSTEKIKSRVEDLIVKTGGECISWDKQQISINELKNSKKNYIFVNNDELKEIPESLKNMYEHIVKLGQRTIPIQEIAMAVLTCSCEKDCNPHFNRAERVFLKKETDSCAEMYPLALDTQDTTVPPPKPEMVIPGSLDLDLELPYTKHMDEPVPSTSSGITANTSLVTPSTKRVSEESESNPFKKMKLDASKSPNSKQPEVATKKRKAEISPEAPPKKSSLKENPFAILRNKNPVKRVAPDNPFANLRVKQEKNLEANPFASAVDKSNDVIVVEEVVPEEKFSPSCSAHFKKDATSTYSNESKVTNLSDIKWLSKSTCKTSFKAEIVDVDDDFKEIYNKFKDTVVIARLPSDARRSNGLLNVSDESVQKSNVKNFKKFKKVPPLKPQNNIVRASYTKHANTSNNEEITILSDGEEDDEYPRPVPKKVNKPRRFDF